jgi:hypothetical protein
MGRLLKAIWREIAEGMERFLPLWIGRFIKDYLPDAPNARTIIIVAYYCFWLLLIALVLYTAIIIYIFCIREGKFKKSNK